MAESNPLPPLFLAAILIALGISLVLGRFVYRRWLYLIGVFYVGSALMYQLLLYVYAHQWFNPAHQYPSAFQGDVFVLPFLVATPLFILNRHLPQDSTPKWVRSWKWQIGAFVLGVLIALYFRHTQTAVYPPDVLDAPWKAWHDFVAFSFLSYVLIYGAPAIWYSTWGLRPLFAGGLRWNPRVLIIVPILVGLVYFGYLTNVADRTKDVHATSPSQYALVVGYDWDTGQVTGPYVVIHQGRHWSWGLPR